MYDDKMAIDDYAQIIAQQACGITGCGPKMEDMRLAKRVWEMVEKELCA